MYWHDTDKQIDIVNSHSNAPNREAEQKQNQAAEALAKAVADAKRNGDIRKK